MMRCDDPRFRQYRMTGRRRLIIIVALNMIVSTVCFSDTVRYEIDDHADEGTRPISGLGVVVHADAMMADEELSDRLASAISLLDVAGVLRRTIDSHWSFAGSVVVSAPAPVAGSGDTITYAGITTHVFLEVGVSRILSHTSSRRTMRVVIDSTTVDTGEASLVYDDFIMAAIPTHRSLSLRAGYIGQVRPVLAGDRTLLTELSSGAIAGRPAYFARDLFTNGMYLGLGNRYLVRTDVRVVSPHRQTIGMYRNWMVGVDALFGYSAMLPLRQATRSEWFLRELLVANFGGRLMAEFELGRLLVHVETGVRPGYVSETRDSAGRPAMVDDVYLMLGAFLSIGSPGTE